MSNDDKSTSPFGVLGMQAQAMEAALKHDTARKSTEPAKVATPGAAATGGRGPMAAVFPLSARVQVAAQVLQAIVASRGHSIAERNKGDDVKHALDYTDQLLVASLVQTHGSDAELLGQALDALIWMSGSSSFAPEGEAGAHFKEAVRPLMDRISRRLGL